MKSSSYTFLAYVCVLLAMLLFACKEAGLPDKPVLTESQTEMLREIDSLSTELGASPLNVPDIDLRVLDSLAGAKVVGLGEGTHGTRDFFEWKHRIFRYLVENHGHRAFGFEADFGESIFFDRYITTGEGNLDDLMIHKMHFWTWRTESVKALLEWMRQYNAGRPESEMIRYVGVDCQYTTYQPDLVLEYLEEISGDLYTLATNVFRLVRPLDGGDYDQMSESEFNMIKDSVSSLRTAMSNEEMNLVAQTSREDFAIHLQLLRTVEQAMVVRYSYAQNENYNWRDLYMAENVFWMQNTMLDSLPVSVWAHNYHVADDPGFGYSGAMGKWLKEGLSRDYQVIGFTFSQGGFTAFANAGLRSHFINSEPLRTSVNYLFHQSEEESFILPLNSFPSGSEAGIWLMQAQPFLSIGSVYDGSPVDHYRTIPLTDHYDWIIYVDETRATHILN